MDVKTLDDQVNQAVLAGRAMEAFEQYYAEDVVMQENADEPCVGKDANRKREEEYFATVEEVHNGALLASAVSDDGVAFGEWAYEVTFKGVGRVKMNQTSVRRWKDGKIASERFYYSKG